MEALLTSVKMRSQPGHLVEPLFVLFRVRVGTTCISASGGNDAAAKGALTNDYPEEVNCAADSFALHATWFGSQAVRMWPHGLVRTDRTPCQY